MRRIVVIGGLAAGPAAAARAARLAPGAEVTLVEAGPDIAYGVCSLPDLVSGAVSDPKDLVPYPPERFERERGVRVLAGHLARKLDAAARRVWLRDGRGRDVELAFDALVLATGARPRRPAGGAPRCLKSVADAVALRAEAERSRGAAAAVLGAGYIGLLAADALGRAGLAVTVFERESLPLRGFEDEARRWMAQAMAESGVELRGGVEVATAVVAGADLVVAALGADPAVELAREAGIAIGPSGAVATDDRLETSRPGVFAAGDCAELVHAVTARRGPIHLATAANRSGRVAGAGAAGGAERMAPIAGALAFRAFGLECGRVGISLAEARGLGLEARLHEARARVPSPTGGDGPLLVSLVCAAATGRLLGAAVIGPQGAALRLNVVAPLVAAGARARDLARADLAYAPFFSPLVDPLVVAARRAG